MKKPQIWMIYGLYGMGKTLGLTYFGVKLKEHYNIIANYKLNGINAKWINDLNPIVIRSFPKNSLFLYSEAYKRMDCRECLKKDNVALSHEIQQIRKRGYDLIYDAERPQLIDFRFTRITNKFIKAYGNFLDILKTENFVKNLKDERLLNFVKQYIKNLDFWKKYSLEDLEHLYLYENILYNYKTELEIFTNKFFVIYGKDFYHYYESEEFIGNTLEKWTTN